MKIQMIDLTSYLIKQLHIVEQTSDIFPDIGDGIIEAWIDLVCVVLPKVDDETIAASLQVAAESFRSFESALLDAIEEL